MFDEEALNVAITRHVSAEISPAQFEDLVVEILKQAGQGTPGFTVTLHDRVTAADGTYDLDATVRYELAGMSFVVVVEAKRHKHTIKRQAVVNLHQQVQSIGAHKGLMIATARYQKGAIKYANAHGIALATIAERQPARGTHPAVIGPPLPGTTGLVPLLMLKYWCRWL